MSSTPKEFFTKVPDWVRDIFIAGQLTAIDFRLFWYLSSFDRYGDEKDIPSQSEIALYLGVSRRSIVSSAARLEALGLFEFKISKWRALNTSVSTQTSHAEKIISPEMRAVSSQTSHAEKIISPDVKMNVMYREKNFTGVENNFTPDIYIDRARSKTIKTNTDLIKEERQELSFSPKCESEFLDMFDSLEQEQSHDYSTIALADYQDSSFGQENLLIETSVPPAPRENNSHALVHNATARFEDGFLKRASGQCPPWRVSVKDLDPGFVEYWREHLEKSEAWRKREDSPMFGDAKRSLLKMERERPEEMQSAYEAYQERVRLKELKAHQAEQLRSSAEVESEKEYRESRLTRKEWGIFFRIMGGWSQETRRSFYDLDIESREEIAKNKVTELTQTAV